MKSPGPTIAFDQTVHLPLVCWIGQVGKKMDHSPIAFNDGWISSRDRGTFQKGIRHSELRGCSALLRCRSVLADYGVAGKWRGHSEASVRAPRHDDFRADRQDPSGVVRHRCRRVTCGPPLAGVGFLTAAVPLLAS